MVYRVYPRACGGTTPPAAAHNQRSGLSPRVRGNRVRVMRMARGLGSIPARAGEPSPNAPANSRAEVYPRACGGTRRCQGLRLAPRGLSPRVRGNHGWSGAGRSQDGSIPARAGEPLGTGGFGAELGVYPRACGGTWLMEWILARRQGLSPRVRGNHGIRSNKSFIVGSIPARAGEP